MLDIRFARSGEVDIAFHVVGEGPIDIVYVIGSYSHLQVGWELPAFRRFCEQLGEFARLIVFDKRGMGMSDRIQGATPLDVRMDDIGAVMDAAGSDSAVVMGASEGGPLSMMFAAAHPERTTSLILMGSEVRDRKDDEWPWGSLTTEDFEAAMSRVTSTWGRRGGHMVEHFAPSQEPTPWLDDWSARLQAHSNTPRGAEAFFRMSFDIDVRAVAPAIRVPTLILHAEGDRICHVENGRFLAREIPDARYVELPGADHLPWFETDPAIGEIREFLTGVRVPKASDRVLATVLFTDVVESTSTAAEVGDQRWREILESHNTIVRDQLTRFRGTEVNTTGDGFLATFDGPARAIRCAHEIAHATGGLGIAVRAGIHTGEVERLGGDIAGIAVHIAARIANQAGPGEVVVSGTVSDLVAGSGIEFEYLGERELRGVPGKWRTYAAIG